MKEKNEKKSGLARFYQKKKDIEKEVEILMEDPYFNSELL